MNTRFVLVRHATCALTHSVLLGRTLDAPLDATGELQAHAVARQLRAFHPARVDASPRRRAQQTAQVIAAEVKCHVDTAAPLDEVDFGSWGGRSFTDLASDPQWRRWNERRGSSRTPGGEDIAGVQERSLGHLRALAQRFPDATLVLVTHAEVVRALLLHALHAPIDDYHRFDIAPASITLLHFGSTGLRVDATNQPVRA